MPSDRLSETFAALAHPARRAILARLGHGKATVQELSKPLKLSGPAMSKHLKVLERSRLISRGRDAQWRPCRIETDAIQKAATWIEQVRDAAESQLDRLESHLAEIQSKPNNRNAKRTVKGE
jgi:DNA-binding transcriptional ArsR family regulator